MSCFLSTQLRAWLGLDDALDVSGVHGVGGIVGTILTGVFADNDENGLNAYGGLNGSFAQGRKQVGYQIAGAAIVVGMRARTSSPNYPCFSLFARLVVLPCFRISLIYLALHTSGFSHALPQFSVSYLFCLFVCFCSCRGSLGVHFSVSDSGHY